MQNSEHSIRLAQSAFDSNQSGAGDPTLSALLEAYLLQAQKAQDYQAGTDRDNYFPLGLPSFATMINIKALRLVSLAAKQSDPSFEPVRDTALDLINYASFLVEWLDRRHA